MSEVQWHTSMIYARDSSWTEKKPILLDFVDPDSLECRQMDELSFSQERVVQFILDHLIPLRLRHDNKPFARDYNVIWTPTLLILDQEGKEYQRTIGFLAADELMPNLLLGVAKSYFHAGNHEAAKMHLDEILAEYPQSSAAPEALYFSGVNLFKKKSDTRELKKAYLGLQEKYPDSTWARRAAPYQLL